VPRFKFRVRFELSPDDRLDFEGERTTFDLGAPWGVIEFIGRSEDKRISSATELIVRSRDGFAEQSDAEALGETVSKALLIAGAQEHLGIDFGKEGPKGFLTDYGRQWVAAQVGFDGQLLDDPLGLIVYDDPGNTRFARFGPARAIIGRPLDRFLSALRESLAAAQRLTDRELLALEVYSASKFEHSLRARFLTLITVVEILADRRSRSDRALELVASFDEAVKGSDLDVNERDQLLGGLRDLRNESIGGACRRLVADRLGSDAAKEFKSWYAARSDLVHAGRTELDLPTTIERVERLVAQLLVTSTRVAT
jgi:hypothetical protein